MLKLTLDQLRVAVKTADQIGVLEGLRANAVDTSFRFSGTSKESPFGASGMTDITCPASVIALEIDAKLANARQDLIALGIDFQQ